WEHNLLKHYKGIFHVNPGGFTYTEGWSELMKDYTNIMDEDTRLREAAGKSKVAAPATTAPAPAAVAPRKEENGGNGLVVSGLLLIAFGLGVAYMVLRPVRSKKPEDVSERDREQE
ncbi:MAG: hydroxylamine reductase, partial [Methylosarcina sp.]